MGKKTIDLYDINTSPKLEDWLIISPFTNIGELNSTTIQLVADLITQTNLISFNNLLESRLTELLNSLDFTGNISGNNLTLTIKLGGTQKTINLILPASSSGEINLSRIDNDFLFGNNNLIGNGDDPINGSSEDSTINNNTRFDNLLRIGN